MGELEEAKKYILKAIEIDKKAFGPDHPTLAIHYNNLASILQAMGELEEAKEYTLKAIEIDKKAFGPDHPNLAPLYNNLALILQAMGELEEAKKYILKAIEIAEKALGPDHPTLATLYNNLASILQAMGELEEAKEYTEKAIEIFRFNMKERGGGLYFLRMIDNMLKKADISLGLGEDIEEDLKKLATEVWQMHKLALNGFLNIEESSYLLAYFAELILKYSKKEGKKIDENLIKDSLDWKNIYNYKPFRDFLEMGGVAGIREKLKTEGVMEKIQQKIETFREIQDLDKKNLPE